MINKNSKDGYTLSEIVRCHIIDMKDEAIAQALIDYAKKEEKQLGINIELYFLDEKVAKEVIKLGIKEYKKKENSNE